MIPVKEIVKLSINSLLRNKTRSLLTMLGIIIGVSAVILLVSIGQGLQNYITQQFESLGANVVAVLPGKLGGSGGEGFNPAAGPNLAGSKLTLKDVERLSRLGSPVESVGAGIEMPATVSYAGNSRYTTIGGLTPAFQKMRNMKTSEGRMVTEADNSADRHVVDLGQSLIDKLFGGVNPIGKYITIGDQKFLVVGILDKIGTGGLVDANDFAIIPLTSAQKIFGIKGVQEIGVEARDKDSIPQVKSMVTKELLKRLKSDDFTVVDSSSLVQTINQILGVITLALGGIAAISLVVGGVGIMNIMLVSVTERTHEIGLRKAVGAKPKDILIQFIVEAVTLSVVGGGIGIAIGFLGSLALNQFIAAKVTWWSVGLAFGVSAAIGVVFGVAPAARASKLNPIEALKYE